MRVALFGYQMPTVEAIYRAYEDAHDQQERMYLGASILGEECWRKLWYGFRWANEPEKFDGRMLRLFQTGHREEARMIDDLRRAGIEVWDRDPDHPEKQIGVSFVGGHARGHLDGVAQNVPEAPKTPHLAEFKTHNIKSFTKLKAEGVRSSKPMHYAQMIIYMREMRLTRALYVAHCKDTDELYVERIEYDPVFAERLAAKAHTIVTAERPPQKLHENPDSRAAFACGWCPAKALCHERAWARRNCRTCLESTPELDGDGRWSCRLHKCDLSADDQRKGCADHRYIPDLVHGEQIDCDPDRRVIHYAMADGQSWSDGE